MGIIGQEMGYLFKANVANVQEDKARTCPHYSPEHRQEVKKLACELLEAGQREDIVTSRILLLLIPC